MKRLVYIYIALFVFSGFYNLVSAQENAAKPEKRLQFIYVLKQIPELVDPENWTERENEIVARHFERLRHLLKEGSLILAGRTLNNDPSTFGIVIFEASSEKEARKIMESDPAVEEKIMTAELFPYRVALIRNQSKE
ncbi:MAG: YciI family protein [Planctomycetes bacterium]|nr:YciI family protein [Planctomycetota bacterium]